jgi:redox-sensitive bicupin YhaK (pirin superfamily)
MSPTSATTTPTTTPTTPAGMAGAIRERFPLGAQWPTLDPFLFVAHHDDAYPEGTEDFGPDASLEGRQMGSDFAAKDGWNMYHGAVVPGFPQHPHRGFETITYVRRGLIDHADSLGAAARFGHGDTQWVTAGAGIVHSEMFPLLNGDAPNPTELFQIWLNLPAANKMAPPAFTMLWAEDTPVVDVTDDEGRTASVTVVVGELAGRAAAAAPAGSWAARDDAEVAIWHVGWAGAAGDAQPQSDRAHGVRLRGITWTSVGASRAGTRRWSATTPRGPGRRAGGRRVAGDAGPPDRRTGGQVRTVRLERPGGHRSGLRRLPGDRVWRLAMGRRWSGARGRPGPLCPPPG